jgi:cytochrome P450
VQETVLSDCTIKPGDRVMAPLCAGNLDPEAFPNPLRLTLERDAKRHLSFGSGVHRCVGMHLARAEFHHVLGEVLRRMPDYRLAEDQLIEYSRQSSTSGWMKAPAAFTPGSRALPQDEDSAVLSMAR